MIQTMIDLLTEARLRELEAIDQYLIHHGEMESEGFNELAVKMKDMAVTKTKHAEKLAERILSLKGEVIIKADTTPIKGQEISEMLATDVALETEAVRTYGEAAAICALEKDELSKDLFEEFLRDEESHLNFLKNVKYYVDRLGVSLYC